MYNILKLNEISSEINNILTDAYNVTDSYGAPEGIMLRSYKMLDYAIPSSLLGVARCGAGVNNIPLDKMTDAGVVVFNTPGANANAVKELVLTELLISNRKIIEAYEWTSSLDPNSDVPSLVEKGKKAFIGPELTGKTLGIVGLGAIGRMVAGAVIALGMNVVGYDPFLSAEGAAELDSSVLIVDDLNVLFEKSNFITLHVPLTNTTRSMINSDTIAMMPKDVRIINCARGELVNNSDIIEACESGRVAKYITDFPSGDILNKKNIITIPHLGASTPEAEDNCAIMAAKQLKRFLENGSIVNSVNFPKLIVKKTDYPRITVTCKGNDCLFSELTQILGDELVNISSAKRGDISYILADVKCIAGDIFDKVNSLDGVIKTRIIA